LKLFPSLPVIHLNHIELVRNITRDEFIPGKKKYDNYHIGYAIAKHYKKLGTYINVGLHYPTSMDVCSWHDYVYGFEPDFTINEIKKWCVQQGYENFTLVQQPLYSHRKLTEFYVVPEEYRAKNPEKMGGNTLDRFRWKEDFEPKVLNVQTNTIDKFVRIKNIKNIDFIKVDAEGADAKIILGAEWTVSKYKPIIQIECPQNIVVPLLRENNYYSVQFKSAITRTYGPVDYWFIPGELIT